MTPEKKEHYLVNVDKSRYNGILHFTHEISVYFDRGEDDKVILSHADVLCSSGWIDYNKNEMDIFRKDYPGAIEEAASILEAQILEEVLI